MIDNFTALLKLIKNLQQVPYLASKNLYRVAHYFLEMDPEKAKDFCKSLMDVKELLEKCAICCVWKEKAKDCVFCSCKKRNRSLICVIENWQDMVSIEKTGGYQGLYHVLGGLLSPLEGIGPEDLSLKQLISRLNNGESKEVILAFNQTPEGEATSSYIANKLSKIEVKVSCLARGLPMGSYLEAMDRMTIYKAISERRPF